MSLSLKWPLVWCDGAAKIEQSSVAHVYELEPRPKPKPNGDPWGGQPIPKFPPIAPPPPAIILRLYDGHVFAVRENPRLDEPEVTLLTKGQGVVTWCRSWGYKIPEDFVVSIGAPAVDRKTQTGESVPVPQLPSAPADVLRSTTVAAKRPHATAKLRATINARMVDLLGREPAATGWTARQWSIALKCSPAAIVGTNVWKSMKLDREQRKAQLTQDRRRKKKQAN